MVHRFVFIINTHNISDVSPIILTTIRNRVYELLCKNVYEKGQSLKSLSPIPTNLRVAAQLYLYRTISTTYSIDTIKLY